MSSGIKDPEVFAAFAETSFSWLYIEKNSLDRCLPAKYSGNEHILDIGSGSGRIIKYHLDRGAVQKNITAVEPDKTLLDYSKSQFKNVNYVNHKIQDADLAVNTFDTATAVMVLCYDDDEELGRGLKKIFDSLKSGGIFYSINATKERYDIRSRDEDIKPDTNRREIITPWGSTEIYYIRSINDYRKLMEETGFEISIARESDLSKAGKLADPQEYANYSQVPARFEIIAVKP